MDTPPSLPQDFTPDTKAARQVIKRAITDGRTWLDPVEVSRLLKAYAIPITPALLARNADEAASAAGPILASGGMVAVKILSPDIVHKSDVGGVRLNLTSDRRCARPRRMCWREHEPRCPTRVSLASRSIL